MAAGGTVASDPRGRFYAGDGCGDGRYGRQLLGTLLVNQPIGLRVHHQVKMSEEVNTDDRKLHIC